MLGVPLERFSRTLDVTVARWLGMLQRYTTYVGLNVRERLANALLELGSKFGAEDARGILITLKVTHADLAELVGASRQRTTEQLIEFENEEKIIRDGRRLIVVPDRMRDLAVTEFVRPSTKIADRPTARSYRRTGRAR
jgi:CRP-like cAMP-binding protein